MTDELPRSLSLIILDLGLAREGDFELVRKVRRCSGAAVIVTGPPCDEARRVRAFDMGVDDYIAKPYAIREVVARVRALLRRIGSTRAKQRCVTDQAGYRFAGWRLELCTRRLLDPTAKLVPLTAAEYGLLIAFLQAPGRILSRGQLIDASRHEDICDRSINVQILRLRRKLEPNPSEPTIIKTVRGSGYVFSVAVEAF